MQQATEQVKETFFIERTSGGTSLKSEDVYDLLDKFYALSLTERLKYRQEYNGSLVFWVIKDSDKWGIAEYNYYTLFKKGEFIESKKESTLKDPKFLFRILPDNNGIYYIIVESGGKEYIIKGTVKK